MAVERGQLSGCLRTACLFGAEFLAGAAVCHASALSVASTIGAYAPTAVCCCLLSPLNVPWLLLVQQVFLPPPAPVLPLLPCRPLHVFFIPLSRLTRVPAITRVLPALPLIFSSQLEAQVVASSKAQSQRQSNGYTAADAEGGAARSLGEDGEEGAAAPASSSQANGEVQEDLAAKVATMQAEVGGLGWWVWWSWWGVLRGNGWFFYATLVFRNRGMLTACCLFVPKRPSAVIPCAREVRSVGQADYFWHGKLGELGDLIHCSVSLERFS